MYSTQTTNGPGVSGTINPAALNSSRTLSNSAATVNITPDTSPRGIKRSRSPDIYAELQAGDHLEDDGDPRSRKRTRQVKTRSSAVSESPNMPLSQSGPPMTPQSQTACLLTQLSNNTPTQVSPPKTMPAKTLKALPTVRDHTTDQLGPEGDEYIPREYDEAGEKKVNAYGQLNDGRTYRCRTFFVPNRGEKLFMLATECARVLGYRDSYLLFNKNRSLYKIIASQAEKEDLIHQDILPYSYRSRQIAIVTARSMFRQFGSRVIHNGRRVRDDYWESKARKQGFTEEDLAGEKRPGAAKARDAAAAEVSASASLLSHHDIVYANNSGQFAVDPHPQNIQPVLMGAPGSLTTLPMITLAPEQADLRLRDYSSLARPRHDMIGPAYQDRTQTSPPTELLSHTHQAAEYNRQINQQRCRSSEYLERRWRQPHKAPTSHVGPPPTDSHESLPSTQTLQSPRVSQIGLRQTSISQQTPQHIMAAQAYSQASHHPSPVAQSHMRSVHAGPIPPSQMGRSSGMPMGASGNSFGYAQHGQMWPPQAQQSPPSFSNYGTQSPHIQVSPHQPSSQLRRPGSNPPMQPALPYSGMQNLGPGYSAPGSGLYAPDRNSQQYMQASTSGSPNWAGPQPSTSGSNWGWNDQPE